MSLKRSLALGAVLLASAAVLSGCGGSGGGGGGTPATYAISGTITGATGVTVNLGGARVASTTTAANGSYSFTGLAAGSYTVTPSKVGYAFTPATTPVTVASADVGGTNFAAVGALQISGTITESAAALEGVSVSLQPAAGGAAVTVSTNASGAYAFTAVTPGSWVVTPSLAGHAFAPLNRSVTLVASSATGQDFTGTSAATVYAIGGQVTFGGAGLAGVTVTLGGDNDAQVVTGAGGSYAFPGLAPGSYTVTPSRSGYAFSPASTAVTLSDADATGRDFSATGVLSVSGQVTLDGVGLEGVSVSLLPAGGAASSTTTAAGGAFSFTGLVAGDYTLTPTLAGYAFTPASRALSLASNTVGQNFTAAGSRAISGVVSGVVRAGVRVDLAGPVTRTMTTLAGGAYGWMGLLPGTYTVTPSIAGHVFAPASRSVDVTAADAEAQDFISSVTPTYALSGTVGGAWGEGVKVTLSGDRSAEATTAANGSYAFANLPAGNYTVTPALLGYVYDPPSRTVDLAAAASGNDFTAASQVPAYSVSGTVADPTGSTGKIYVRVMWADCTGCETPVAGTSLDAPGAFTIRGVGPGNYVVNAFRDTIGYGIRNANYPTGAGASFQVTSANVTGRNVSLSSAALPAVVAPTGVMAMGGAGGALVFWDPVTAGNFETAIAYKVSWGPDPSASAATAEVPARDDAHFFQSGLADGTTRYYKVAALFPGAGGTRAQSAWSAAVSATTGAGTGGSSVKGTVTFDGAAGGPLFIAMQGAGGFYVATVTSPVSPQDFTVAGLPDGAYAGFFILDRNNNGFIDPGDVSNTGGGNGVAVTVSGDVTGLAVTLAGGGARVYSQSESWSNGSSQSHTLAIMGSPVSKLPVKMTLVSGVGFALPQDMGRSWEFTARSVSSSSPVAPGSPYAVRVTYADASTETFTVTPTVTSIPFPRSLAETATAPYSPDFPLLTWQDPTSVPSGGGYLVELNGNNGSFNWVYPDYNSLAPLSQHSVQYGAGGGTALVSGQSYEWRVTVVDQDRNRATMTKMYTVP